MLTKFTLLIYRINDINLVNMQDIYVFVCLGFFVPLENFSLVWRRQHYQRRAANFDLCSAHMTIEQ